MAVLPFGEWRPDVADYNGQHSRNISGVVPRGDGYGPVRAIAAASSALPGACRGLFFARKNDGSIQIFAGISNRLYVLNNTTFAWTPVSKVTTVAFSTDSAIDLEDGFNILLEDGSNLLMEIAGDAIVNLASHPFAANDPVQFTSTVSLPTGISAGVVYYVISSGLGANSFKISATLGGGALQISSVGSGVHSITGSYSALSSNAHWQFEQFNNFVFAVQQNTAPQVFDLTTSTAFADLAGSPSQASYIAIVNRFVVLTGLISPNVYRVQWSGLNATTTWTSGVTQSDSQDLPDGGIVRAVAGGEFGVIFQDQSIRRMTYAPGSPYVFGFDRISKDDGLLAPYSVVRSGDRVFFLSPQGFKMLLPGGYPTPIGKEKIDRTFLAEVDMSNLHMVIGANDPNTTKVYWAYKTTSHTSTQFNKIIVYDWMLERWGVITQSGEYIATMATPGVTLEGVDTAFGSNIDTLTLGSLDDISLAANPALAAADTSHMFGLFSGATLEATLETPEQGADGRRLHVRGLRAITDSATVYGSVSKRESPNAAATYSTESTMDARGYCPQRANTRYARGKLRIPAGTSWTYAAGVEPDVVLEGMK